MIYITSPHLGDLWKNIQKKYIHKNTSEEYTMCLFDNNGCIKHLEALKCCLQLVGNKNPKEDDLIILLDSDAFPISKNWILKVRQYLKEGNEFVAVQRLLETKIQYRGLAHPSFVAWYYKTKISFKRIEGDPFVAEYKQKKWKGLHRSNMKNFHIQLFGIYDDMIYHHGAGSRTKVKIENYDLVAQQWNRIFKDSKKFINELRRG